MPSVLLDNDFALNVCPIVTAIALGFSPTDFGPSLLTVRTYDGTQRTVNGHTQYTCHDWASQILHTISGFED